MVRHSALTPEQLYSKDTSCASELLGGPDTPLLQWLEAHMDRKLFRETGVTVVIGAITSLEVQVVSSGTGALNG